MREFTFDTLLDPNAATRSYFSFQGINRFLMEHEKGHGFSKEIFSLLVLELWHRQFLSHNVSGVGGKAAG